MRKIINQRQRMPAPDILPGFKDLLRIYNTNLGHRGVQDPRRWPGLQRRALGPRLSRSRRWRAGFVQGDRARAFHRLHRQAG